MGLIRNCILVIICFSNLIVYSQITKPIVHPFKSSYLNDSSLEWLNILNDKLTSAEIVGIGEVTHGTMETFRLKNRIFKYLVEEKGFREYILEYADSELRNLNDHLSNDYNNDPKVIDSIFKNTFSRDKDISSLYNKDFKDLIIYIKEYNISHQTDKISFRGMDIQVQWNTFWNGWINEISKNKIREVYGKRNLSIDEMKTIIKNWYASEKQNLKDSLNESCFLLLEMDYKNFMNYIEYIKNGANKNISMIRMRDSLMYENVKTIKKQKAVISAHNLHVSNSGFASAQWNAKLLGNYLVENYANKYYIILTAFSNEAAVNIYSKNNFRHKTFNSNSKSLPYILNKKFQMSEGLIFDNDLKDFGIVKLNNIGSAGDNTLISAKQKSFDALIYFQNLSPSLLFE